jgi:hypothetical protein
VGCLIVLIGLFSPRLAIILVAIFSNDLTRSFHGSWVAPLIGFFLAPWTTLVYTLLWTTNRHVYGVEWLFVGIAFLLDLGSLFGGSRYRRRD